MDMDQDMASAKALCVHTIGIHVTAYSIANVFWLYLCIQRAVHFPPFSPASVMALVHSKPLLDVCLREEEVL